MIEHPLVLAAADRLELFLSLRGTHRLFQTAEVWTDDHGIAWAVARAGRHAVAVTWLGPGWVFDPKGRQQRADEWARQQKAMQRAAPALHRRRLKDTVRHLRLGGHAERLLWCIHAAALSQRTSLLTMADVTLREAVWGSQRRLWPCHWRKDLLQMLDCLSWLHLAPWPEQGRPVFGAETVLLTHVGDLKGTADDDCPADCPERSSRRHHHLQIDIGPTFLGALEVFARSDPDSGIRSYEFRVDGGSKTTPSLRRSGRRRELVSVFLPAKLGEQDQCALLSAPQHRLLQALVRETTRAARPRRRRNTIPIPAEPERLFQGLVPDFRGRKSIRCPALESGGPFIGFNGNKKRRGCGYKLASIGGWMAKARYPQTDMTGFLGDCAALAKVLTLRIVGIDREHQFFSLEQMQGLAATDRGRRVLERLHVRVYTSADYEQRWSALFRETPQPLDRASDGGEKNAVLPLVGAMAQKRISQRALARRLGQDPAFLNKLLRGLKPWPGELLEKAQRIVADFGVTPERRAPVSSSPAKLHREDGDSALAMALDYLHRGWCVLPQLPVEKHPCVKWKRFQQQRPSAEQVRAWFRQFPVAGPLVLLGPISQLFAIDVDGPEAHQALLEHLGKEPVAPKVLSGSGKPFRYHLLFRCPQVATWSKKTPWHPHLEFRGEKGLLVLPPSLHKSGQRYRWAPGRSLNDVALSDPPVEVVEALVRLAQPRRPKGTSYSAKPLDRSAVNASPSTHRFLAGEFADGPRWNDRLFHAACDLRGRGIPLEVAEPLLLAGAQPRDEAETNAARSTIQSAYAQFRTPGRN
jgi:hypothetical protein